MMLFAFFLSCMVTGTLACNENRCKDNALANEMLEVSFLPNKEELKTFCPKVKTFLECEKESLECRGQSLNELATSANKEESTKAKALLAGLGVVRDVCDEDSPIHTDYVSSVSCYREYFNGDPRNCRGPVLKPVDDFIDHIYAETYEEDMDYRIFAETRCLRSAYELVCILDKLGDACGSVAQSTAMNGLERFKGVLGAGLCSDLENTAELMSKFLDYLELDEERRINTQGIFDLLQRRR